MTYEDALDWLSENVPIDMYDSYRDWYEACKNEIQTPALWDNPRFNRMHEAYWKNNKDVSEPQDIMPQETQTQREEIEREEISKRPPSSYREPEQSIEQPEYLPSEQERFIPATGKAPDIYARQEPIDLTPPKEQKFTFFKKSRAFIKRALGL